jgi:hypothetical protein
VKGSLYDSLSLYHHHFSQQLRVSRNYNEMTLPKYLRRGTSIFIFNCNLVPAITNLKLCIFRVTPAATH